MERRPLSLQARSLLAAGIALAAFLGLTGFALDTAIYQTLKTSLRERLQSYVYSYLATSDVSRDKRWLPPDVGPDSRFDRPDGALLAGVVGPVRTDGGLSDRWRSPSAQSGGLPLDSRLPRGEEKFEGPIDTPRGPLYIYSLGVTWDNSVDLTLHVAEDAHLLDQQRATFRRTLFVLLAALGIGLLALLLATLRWSLRPLRRVAQDLMRVEYGEREHLSDDYPTELARLAGNLNDFIDSEREHLQRYRNTLADLAHSLKTPLAVLRSQLELSPPGSNPPEQLRWTVVEQVGRMDEIVAYQLSRAATSGHTTFAAPIAIGPCAEEVVSGLEKIYASRKILCEFDIDAAARFYGEQGDLLELLGNLLENAFKWAKSRVLFTAHPLDLRGAKRAGLELVIEDDGPGIPDDKVESYLQRGVRGDERVQGYGIGLAIVQQINKAYRGTMKVTRSATLGGARFMLSFDPN